jgi:hypothetical protein
MTQAFDEFGAVALYRHGFTEEWAKDRWSLAGVPDAISVLSQLPVSCRK